MTRYSPKTDPDDTFVMYGWTAAATMAKALEGMQEPSRAALMDSVRNLDAEIGTLLPGNRVKTGPGDAYPVEGAADPALRRPQLGARRGPIRTEA